MKFMSRSVREHDDQAPAGVHYDSFVSMDSSARPGVRFAIHRISFGRRMELSRQVREVAERPRSWRPARS